MRLLVAFFLLLATAGAGLADKVELGEDGLHKPAWFTITFRDIAEDVAAAKQAGKRLALIFEQAGCGYCKEVHETVLVDPEVKKFISEHFVMVQYNLFGSEEVTDTDGETLTEKTAARKWGVIFTPTILFLPETVVPGKPVAAQAVARMPGAFHKGTFLDMFVWVSGRGYATDESFPQYHARMVRERQKAKEAQAD